jgi:hypothetical protein
MSDKETTQLKQELEALRDELRVQANLAAKEARDMWHTLEKTLVDAEKELEKTGAKALSSARAALVKARQEYQRRRDERRTTPLA